MIAGAFLRSIGWGIVAGAVAGVAVGFAAGLIATVGGSHPAMLLFYPIAGFLFGAACAILPTLIGAVVVTTVLWKRHPQPSSFEAVERDLTVVFAAVVGVFDAVLLVPTALTGSLGDVAVGLAFVAFVNACMVPILRRARRSIARGWTSLAGGPIWA